MSAVLGTSPGVFLGLTVLLFGLTAFRTGEAIAQIWGLPWQAALAAFGLAVADRLLAAALFDSPPLSATAAAAAWMYLTAVALFAWRATLARKMVRQYPWLYEPAGILGWRSRNIVDGRERH
ncbi:MAG TPA: hypothetical protein VGB82_23045 [Alphaproteobacteria bacterium]